MSEATCADVYVVGGGPAGLASAIALRQQGFSITVVDCAVPPIDKACGEGLMPGSVRALRDLGVRIPETGGFPLRGVRFVDGRSSVVADFPAGPAIGLRRIVLHELLKARSREVGVALQWGIKGVHLIPEGLVVDDKLVRPKLIVGADGQNSAIRRSANLSKRKHEARRYGFRRHFAIPPWSEYMELRWGSRCQLYITPISEREIGVALLTGDPKLRLEEGLEEFPSIRSRLAAAEPSSAEMGAVTLCRTLDRVWREGVALVGDASGSVDAITGEGMCLCFGQALALAQAFKAGDLARYQQAHRALGRTPRLMASLMLAMGRHGPVQRRALASLARYPDVFARLLAIHVGEASFLDVCNPRLFNLGLKFLTS